MEKLTKIRIPSLYFKNQKVLMKKLDELAEKYEVVVSIHSNISKRREEISKIYVYLGKGISSKFGFYCSNHIVGCRDDEVNFFYYDPEDLPITHKKVAKFLEEFGTFADRKEYDSYYYLKIKDRGQTNCENVRKILGEVEKEFEGAIADGNCDIYVNSKKCYVFIFFFHTAENFVVGITDSHIIISPQLIEEIDEKEQDKEAEKIALKTIKILDKVVDSENSPKTERWRGGFFGKRKRLGKARIVRNVLEPI